MADSDAAPHSLSETAVHGVLRQPELLERIAYYALTLPGPPCPPSPSEPLLGPPTGLTAVLLVSRTWHAALSFDNNPRFYARLFGFKFDSAAARRRLSARWRTSACLAAEFRKRVETLARVRTLQRLGDMDDLWTCYVMMLENDGKNERQLCDYARLPAYLVACTLLRGGPAVAPALWVTEPERTTLLVWLWWFTSTRDGPRCQTGTATLREEQDALRLRLEDRAFHVLVATAFRFPSIHRPLCAWFSPLSSSPTTPSSADVSPALHGHHSGCTGPAPALASITHFAHKLRLSFPVLTPAALLAWAGRTERSLDGTEDTLEARTARYPATVQEARARARADAREERVRLAAERAEGGEAGVNTEEGEDGEDEDEDRAGQLPTRDAVRAFQRLRMHVPGRISWGRTPGREAGFDEAGNRVLVGERPEADADERSYELEEAEDGNDRGSERAGWRAEVRKTPARSRSKTLDAEWYRLVAPGTTGVEANAGLAGMRYELGAVAGRWRGRLIHTAFDVHMRLVLEPRAIAHVNEQLLNAPAGWVLREHHCMTWGVPIDIGQYPVRTAGSSAAGEEEYEDDFLRAWIPEGYRTVERSDHIEVVDEEGHIMTRYETYYPHGPRGPRYAESVLRKLEGSGVLDEWRDSSRDTDMEAEVGAEVGAMSGNPEREGEAGEEDEYEDFVENRNSGVSDILVTGHTDDEWGAAWGRYELFGRIRPSDGLVVLHRTPCEEHRALGRWTFYGYIHGKNLVGRWRETATAPHLIGFEGGFIVTRQ